MIFIISISFGQDLTGKWVSVEDYNEQYYAELFLIGNESGAYYGHSYDNDLEGGFCRFWVKGYFVYGRLNGSDGELIKKSPDHYPTDYNLVYEKVNGEEFLFGSWHKYEMTEIGKIYHGITPIRYRKVSEVYKVYNEQEMDEEPPFEKQKEEFKKQLEQEIEQERIRIEEEEREKQEELKKQEQKKKIQEEEQKLTKLKEERTDKLLSTIRIKELQKVTINIWDFGKEDNDLVTIFVNDKILAKRVEIKNKIKKFSFLMEKDVKEYKIVFLANNLGDIPPNSAQVRISYGKRQHNFKLFTDEENNAAVIIQNLAANRK